eukprot:1091973-Amphidinium_carterae.1
MMIAWHQILCQIFSGDLLTVATVARNEDVSAAKLHHEQTQQTAQCHDLCCSSCGVQGSTWKQRGSAADKCHNVRIAHKLPTYRKLLANIEEQASNKVFQQAVSQPWEEIVAIAETIKILTEVQQYERQARKLRLTCAKSMQTHAFVCIGRRQNAVQQDGGLCGASAEFLAAGKAGK